jgi:putative addiction module component (TIGR02574 family)
MSDLRNQIDSLSAAEKAELLDAVWESLEADALSLTEAQRAELNLDYRIARLEQKLLRCHPLGASQGGPDQKTVKLPVVWIRKADAELKEAHAW